ncbi:MAG: hypothetical protein J6V07_01685 [Clostridia bacterium]|nr:hypothetical protein [Clostridia bacterium]
MERILEKLWDEYLAEECAAMDTEEERRLVRVAAEKHKTAEARLTKEQSAAVEEYVEALYDSHSFFVKKAFLKGCELATAFLIEARRPE